MVTSGMLTEVKIDGTDVTNSVKHWKIVESFGKEIQDIKIEFFRTVFTTLPGLRAGQTLTVKRGLAVATEQFVFDGFTDTVKKGGALTVVMGKDKLIKLVNSNVRKSFNGIAFPGSEAKISDIAKTLIETFGGLVADVVDSGTAITLKKFLCRDTDVFSRLKDLAQIIDYQIFFNPITQKVRFEPKGFVTSGTTFDTGVNILGTPVWNRDASQLANKLIVKGAVQEIQREELFNGDGTASQTFELDFKPIDVQFFEIIASVDTERVGGVVDSTATFDYEVDKEESEVTITSNTPASGTDNVKIIYTYAVPVPVQVLNAASIATFGERFAVKHFQDIQSVDDAKERGSGWLTKYGTPFLKVSFKMSQSFDITIGLIIDINDTINSEIESVLVNQITREWPHTHDKIQAGDEEWRTAEWGVYSIERIRRLEEEFQQASELLVQFQEFTRNNTVLKRRYMKQQRRIVITGNDVFILDHPDYGTLDINKLGDAGFDFPSATAPIERLIWPFKLYLELFDDVDFLDATAGSTANWNTTTQQLEF